ncbi:arylesterase [Allostella vacuolata]|nr:arylesterase [Stella vacuolata]
MDQPETVEGTGGGGMGGSIASGADRVPSRSYGANRRRFNAGLLAGVLFLAGLGAAAAEPVKLLALGDSLTAGYGLPASEGFVPRLEAALRARGRQISVINAGVSGDTTAGGRARIDWALGDRPDAALVALGANDALRGLDPAEAERNLDAILARLGKVGVPALLVGMMAPPNLGRDYGAAFDGIYARLARRHGVPLYPFFLDGVAADPALNQPDGIHPNARGVAVMVERILPAVERLLDRKS